MGAGSYTAADWTRLRQSKKLSENSTVDEIFQSSTQEKYLPRFIRARESRDSAEHPRSTPIIIGLDDTGSMGYLSEKIATVQLNELMQTLYATRVVSDPQLLFSFYGDRCDSDPLQVTQFESDIRIAEQLTGLSFLNHGQGYVVLTALWHFAARYTDIDSFNNRGEKGFLFTVGDDAANRGDLSPDFMNRVFGEKVHAPLTAKEAYRAAAEKYEIFHIVLDRSGREGFVEKTGYGLPEDRVIVLNETDLDALPEVIIAQMLKTRKQPAEKILEAFPEEKRPVVKKAVFGP